MRRSDALLWGGLLLVGVGVLLALSVLPDVQLLRPSAPATQTPEPLIPTRTPVTRAASSAPTVTRLPPIVTTTPSPVAVATLRPGSNKPDTLWRGRPRWGIGVAIGPIWRYDVKPLYLGWYLDWKTRHEPSELEGVEYVQMVRLWDAVLRPDVRTIADIARSNPGALWLIGNEADVKWQDNVEPAAYARLYHAAYIAIKTADATAEVAIGGISQPTPLRLRYLERVLSAYREQFGVEMPMDVWNVHNFILREERGSWGVDIPPGMPDERGTFYQVEDSGNLEIFQKQIVDFRRWMAARGYRNRPLIVSEYGIPMPEDYGFPPERVVAFLTGTFDFFLTATDPALGYSADGDRLVQRWCWYSLDDTAYPTGSLFDVQTGKRTAIGNGWAEFVTPRLSR